MFRFNKERGSTAVVIPGALREIVGQAILGKLSTLDCRIVVLAVAGMHAHGLVEFPDDVRRIKAILGQCKMKASHAIREQLPGRIWGYGGSWKRVETVEYHRRVYEYILRQDNAWIWSYKEKIA